MIAGTRLLSGALLAFSVWLFAAKILTAGTQTAVWVVIFFASAGTSAAYLTVSEIFPIEIRAKSIAVFFAIGAIFGALGPVIYGALIGNGTSRTGLTIGYIIGGVVMILGSLVEVFFGINAEGKSQEEVARPLTQVHMAVSIFPASALICAPVAPPTISPWRSRMNRPTAAAGFRGSRSRSATMHRVSRRCSSAGRAAVL
jgi:MFS family permease